PVSPERPRFLDPVCQSRGGLMGHPGPGGSWGGAVDVAVRGLSPVEENRIEIEVGPVLVPLGGTGDGPDSQPHPLSGGGDGGEYTEPGPVGVSRPDLQSFVASVQQGVGVVVVFQGGFHDSAPALAPGVEGQHDVAPLEKGGGDFGGEVLVNADTTVLVRGVITGQVGVVHAVCGIAVAVRLRSPFDRGIGGGTLNELGPTGEDTVCLKTRVDDEVVVSSDQPLMKGGCVQERVVPEGFDILGGVVVGPVVDPVHQETGQTDEVGDPLLVADL